MTSEFVFELIAPTDCQHRGPAHGAIENLPSAADARTGTRDARPRKHFKLTTTGN
jgi:hypothetical protein